MSSAIPVSQRLLDALKRFEGFDSNAYWDATGKKWTIGWGRTHQVAEGDITTPEKEQEWLISYLADLSGRVRDLLNVEVSQLQHEALISFAFNCGLGALRGSTLLKKLNAGDRSGAAREFDKWIMSGQVVLNGLVARRAEERSWFEV